MPKSAPNNRHQTSEAAGTGEYLIDYGADSSKGEQLILIRCPICDEQLIDDLDYSPDHTEITDHIATHSPADLDLDGPYRFTPMADILIQLHGLKAD
jgi:hypothetical protein